VVTMMTATGQTDTGRERPQNEDAFGLFPATPDQTVGLYLVADGMGGHDAGEVASHLAVDRIGAAFETDRDGPLTARIERAIRAGNECIYLAGRDVGQRGMGSTIVCAAIEGTHLVSAHVGDSRMYRLRRHTLEPLTRDHSWVQERVAAGIMTALQAEQSQRRNVITKPSVSVRMSSSTLASTRSKRAIAIYYVQTGCGERCLTSS